MVYKKSSKSPKEINRNKRLQKLLKVRGDWFSQEELEANRQEVENKLKF